MVKILIVAVVLSLLSGTAAGHSAVSIVSIMDIQGRGHSSSLAGDTVVTFGVVTALSASGFCLQDETGDGDWATSDGLFVFTSAQPLVTVGDRVRVEGRVIEFLPGGDSDNLSVTEIFRPTVVVLSGGHTLPPPVVLGAGGRPPPTEIIDDAGLTRYEPAVDGIDYYESLEGRRVTVENAVAVSASGRFGETWLCPAATRRPG